MFELGDKVVLEFVDGNVLNMTINGKTISTGVEFATGYWKNVELTADGDDYTLYINGVKKAELLDTGLVLADINTDTQRYLIGRSKAEADPFFKGIVDNFVVKSVVKTADELNAEYSAGEHTIVSSKAGSVVTTVGNAPVLPAQVNALFNDGIYEKCDVIWDAVDSASYAQAGSFTVNGILKDTDIAISLKVIVAAGTLQNVAAEAIPTAIYNNPSDLGGVNGLNDGFNPVSSGDTSHGAWHNWGGNQGAPAWVQYNWDTDQIIASMDAYFFKDPSGNFAPANYSIEYLNEEGSWCSVTNAVGLGVKTNQYNTTTFDPVVTKGFRMTMNPAALGCGVIEWKVNGYKDGAVIDKAALNIAIATANGLKAALFSAGMDTVATVLVNAKAVVADKNSTQEAIDAATSALNVAICSLTPVIENNKAAFASVSASFTSSWEKLTAVNDGAVSTVSNSSECKHWGTWGNESAFESVTYTWGVPVKINSSDLYIWTDGGGIEVPSHYVYEYLDKDGNWNEVTNAVGYEVLKTRTSNPAEEPNLDGFNTTTFDEVTTTAIRVSVYKEEPNGNGVGLVEWRVFGPSTPKIGNPIITTDPSDTTAIANNGIVNVRLSSAVSGSAIAVTGSAIYYTLDGTTPDKNSTLYTGEFNCSTNNKSGEVLVIKAIDTEEGYLASNVVMQPIVFLAEVVEPGEETQTQTPSITTDPSDTTAVANNNTVKVQISAVSGAAIYYTTDGSTPNSSSTIYTGEIPIATTNKGGETVVINAIAIEEGCLASEVTSKSINFLAEVVGPGEETQTQAPSITTDPSDTTPVANNNTVKVQISAVSGAAIYYTTDGSTPNSSSTVYTGAIPIATTNKGGETIVINAIAIADGYLASEVTSKSINFLAEVVGPGEETQTQAPSITTDPSVTTAVANNGTVKIHINSVAGAVIYYTTDGTTPNSSSTVYTGEFVRSTTNKAGETLVIKAFAVAEGYLASNIVEKVITFSPATTDNGTQPTTPSQTQPTDTTTKPATETVKGDENTVSSTLSSSISNGKVDISVKLDTVQLKKQLDGLTASSDKLEIQIVTESLIDQAKKNGVDNVDIGITLPSDILANNQDKVDLKLPKELLEAAKEKNMDVKVSAKDEKGNELYSWSFDGQDLANTDKNIADVNLSLSVDKANNQATLSQLLGTTENNQNNLVINFNHEGILPAQASVRVFVGNLVDDRNNAVYLYHYNPKTNKLETLPYSSKYMVDSEGYITVNVLHCSDYVVLQQPADSSVITSLLNQIKVVPVKKTIYLGVKSQVKACIYVVVPTTLEVVDSLSDKTTGSAIGAVSITFKSSNTAVVTVDSKGNLTAIKAGKATIYTTIKLYSNKTKVVKTIITIKDVPAK